MAKKKKAEEAKDKDAVARERVEALLADVPKTLTKTLSDVSGDDSESEDALESLDKDKAASWLENQVSALTERNEQLEAELQAAKEDFQRLADDFVTFREKAGSGVPLTDAELVAKVKGLFKKFEAQYLGQNPEGKRYTHIMFVNPPNNTGVLDEFIRTFGDLLKK